MKHQTYAADLTESHQFNVCIDGPVDPLYIRALPRGTFLQTGDILIVNFPSQLNQPAEKWKIDFIEPVDDSWPAHYPAATLRIEAHLKQ